MIKTFLLPNIILIGLLVAGCAPPVEVVVTAAPEEKTEEVAAAASEEDAELPINVAPASVVFEEGSQEGEVNAEVAIDVGVRDEFPGASTEVELRLGDASYRAPLDIQPMGLWACYTEDIDKCRNSDKECGTLNGVNGQCRKRNFTFLVACFCFYPGAIRIRFESLPYSQAMIEQLSLSVIVDPDDVLMEFDEEDNVTASTP
jgi:hypothetical protein